MSSPATPPATAVSRIAERTTHRGALRVADGRLDAIDFQVDLPIRTIGVEGELDFANGELLTSAAHRLLLGCLAEPPALTANVPARCDLGGVRFIDAGGIGALVSVRHMFSAAGVTLRLVNASPRVRRLLSVCHLEAMVEPVDDPSASRASAAES